MSATTATIYPPRPIYDSAVAVQGANLIRVSAQRLEQILLDRGARPRRKAVSA